MQALLKEISQKALLLNNFDFSEEQIAMEWLGRAPASEAAIAATERRLNVQFPNVNPEF